MILTLIAAARRAHDLERAWDRIARAYAGLYAKYVHEFLDAAKQADHYRALEQRFVQGYIDRIQTLERNTSRNPMTVLLTYNTRILTEDHECNPQASTQEWAHLVTVALAKIGIEAIVEEDCKLTYDWRIGEVTVLETAESIEIIEVVESITENAVHWLSTERESDPLDRMVGGRWAHG